MIHAVHAEQIANSCRTYLRCYLNTGYTGKDLDKSLLYVALRLSEHLQVSRLPTTDMQFGF